MLIIGYIAALLMGTVLGLLGAGGSILTVPILVYLFHLRPVTATGHSLFIVGVASWLGVASYAKKGNWDLRTGLVFAIPSFFGVTLARGFLLPRLPDTIFEMSGYTLTKDLLIMFLFAALTISASTLMIRQAPPAPSPASRKGRHATVLASIGFLVGGITGFVGVGGGFMIVPTLVLFARLNMRTAVGTSLFIIAANSTVGFITDLAGRRLIHWSLLLSVTAVALIGIRLGTRVSNRASEHSLRKAFGWFVLLTGTFILIRQLIEM